MKVFVTGGTGFVGTTVVGALIESGHEATVLTRSPPQDQPQGSRVAYLEGDPRRPGSWQDRVPEHEGVINLAGASIFRRWSPANKREIRASRIDTTRNLAEGLSGRKGRETVLVSASGTGYYGFRQEEGLGEDASAGRDFLAELSLEWEAEAGKAAAHGVRVAVCRLGVVLGRNGGALKSMAPAFRAGLGSPLGKGDQWFPWIHETDLARIFLFALTRPEASGPFNCTAPHPVRNREFTKALGRALRRPTFLPSVPGPVLKIALGEFAQVLLEGQCAIPSRLLELGFTFRYPALGQALEDLLP